MAVKNKKDVQYMLHLVHSIPHYLITQLIPYYSCRVNRPVDLIMT